MKEKRTIGVFKVLFNFVIYWFLFGIIIYLISFFAQEALTSLVKNTGFWLQTIGRYIYYILVDFLALVLATFCVNRKYQIERKDKKKVGFCFVIIMLLVAFFQTYAYLQEYQSLVDSTVDLGFNDPFARLASNPSLFILVMYPVIVLPRLLMLIYPIQKLNATRPALGETQLQKTIKLETEETVYQKINTNTNEVIDSNAIESVDNIWIEENDQWNKKDILIVPEVKEEKIEEISPISIKPISEVKSEVPKIEEAITKKVTDGIIKFEGLIPDVNVTDDKKEEIKPEVTLKTPVYPERHEDQTCPNCGAKVNNNATVCFMCGKPL